MEDEARHNLRNRLTVGVNQGHGKESRLRRCLPELRSMLLEQQVQLVVKSPTLVFEARIDIDSSPPTGPCSPQRGQHLRAVLRNALSQGDLLPQFPVFFRADRLPHLERVIAGEDPGGDGFSDASLQPFEVLWPTD